jgi:predicted MFS family arabinose efflux permease
VAAGLLARNGLTLGVGNVALALLLTRESPAGEATTLTLSQAATSLGSALGGSAGGLLLVAGGYGALGVGATALCVAAAVLAWWSRPTQGHVPAPAGPAPRPPGPLDRRGALQEH